MEVSLFFAESSETTSPVILRGLRPESTRESAVSYGATPPYSNVSISPWHERINTGDIIPKEPWLLRFAIALKSFAELKPNWDTYGAQPPNETAITLSRIVLYALYEMNLQPVGLAPSREEGTTFSFFTGKKWAAIECANTGEIVAVRSDGSGDPEVWEVENNR